MVKEEEQLIIELQTASSRENAFRELITLYKERLYWHIRKIVISHDDSDDVLQNTFIKVYKNIDKFKGVNDTYGHKAGDIVLKTVAQKCVSKVRKSDFFCRYGGEEFALILPETNLSAAITVAETLRQSIEKCSFQYGNQNVPITISCGLAEFKTNDTPGAVFIRSDKALYKAKETGRNRCVSEEQLHLI